MRIVIVTVCIALVPVAAGAQRPVIAVPSAQNMWDLPRTAGHTGHYWDLGLAPTLQNVRIDGERDATNAGLAVRAGLVLPGTPASWGRLAIFLETATDAAIGAVEHGDISFFTADVGVQLLFNRRLLGAHWSARGAHGLMHTAETRHGDVLHNYSGTGYSAAVSARRRVRGRLGVELGVTRSSGRFSNVQQEQLGPHTTTRDVAVNRGYSGWRMSLGLVY